MGVYPEVNLDGIKQRRFNIIDRISILAKQKIQKEEDQKIFDAIWRATVPPGVVIVKDEECIGRIWDPDKITKQTLTGT